MTRLDRQLAAVILGILSVALVACEDNDPTAPAMSTTELSANPASVDLRTETTGHSDLSALVLDEDGRPLNGINVFFSSTSGVLASGGAAVESDDDGIARDRLTLTRDDDEATVKARGSGAGEDTVTVGILLPGQNAAPTAVARASASSAKVDQSLTFDGSDSTDPDGTIVTFRWSFSYPLAGGGSTTDFVQGDRAAAAIVSRSFPAAGTVTTRLTVTDDGAKTTTVTVDPSVTIVSHYAPTARISGSSTATATQPYQLDGSASTDDPRDTTGAIVRYDWDMGDGTVYVNRTDPTITHAYLIPTTGTPRTAILVVWDNGDGTNCNVVSHLCNDSKSGQATLPVTVVAP